MKEKSILENVPVESSSFDEVFGKHRKRLLTIVGHCTRCGNPLYGHNMAGDDPIEIKRSCSCYFPLDSEIPKKKFEETVHTK